MSKHDKQRLLYLIKESVSSSELELMLDEYMSNMKTYYLDQYGLNDNNSSINRDDWDELVSTSLYRLKQQLFKLINELNQELLP